MKTVDVLRDYEHVRQRCDRAVCGIRLGVSYE